MGANHHHRLSTFVVGDIETTGFEPEEGDRIVEVAFIRFVDGKEKDSFVSLVNPKRPIPPDVTEKVHHITDEMIADAPTFEELLPKIIEFVGDDPLAFHYASFDVDFLREEARALKRRWPNDNVISCTKENATNSGLFSKPFELSVLGRQIGLRQDYHRARPDAFAAGKLLLYIMERRATITPW